MSKDKNDENKPERKLHIQLDLFGPDAEGGFEVGMPSKKDARVEPPPAVSERIENAASASAATEEAERKAEAEEEASEATAVTAGDDDETPPVEDEVFSPRNGGPMAQVMDDNFLQFASYSICDRAIPTIEDGLKPVQRRILHTLFEGDDGRFVKVATVVGRTMAYHPHGDASIYGALVNLENKRYLIEGQGNFGNIYTGDPAAAGRYIECRLTDLAREEIFNKKTTSYIPNYDGRSQEPVLLPSKLPLLLMLGANGIAVGMSTLIMPHNFMELLNAEIEMIRDPNYMPVLYPDFQTGGVIDCSDYHDGNGKIICRCKFETEKNMLVITEIPYGQTVESIIESIEKAVRTKKVALKSCIDLTSNRVRIELTLLPGSDPEKVKQQLYAATNCQFSITANMIVLENNRPRQTTVSETLRANVKQLMELNKRELEIREGELLEEQNRKTLVQIFVEERIYKRIEKAKTGEAVYAEVYAGFKPFEERLLRPLCDDDVKYLLEIPIRRISLFDINKNHDEIEAIVRDLTEVRKNLGQLRRYSIDYLKRIIKKYQYKTVEVEVTPEGTEAEPAATKKKSKKGAADAVPAADKKKKKVTYKNVTVESYPRLTQVENFESIDVKTVTAVKLDICYDEETGFIGHALKNQEPRFSCTSADKIILVWKDGKYRLIAAPEKDKVFVDKNLLYMAVYDRDRQYTLVYTESEVPFSCLKRFSFGGMIMNKDYKLLPEEGVIRYLEPGTPDYIWIKFKPAKGQRILQKKVNTAEEVAVKGVSARGKQLTVKPIMYVSGGSNPPRFWDESLMTEKSSLF